MLLLKSADLVLTGGPSLYESKRTLHPNVLCLPSAVDADHYANALAVARVEPMRRAAKLQGAIQRQGLTLVPLSIYFNGAGKAKVELALARGPKAHDKRETIKERDWKREQQRLMRSRG